jgi:hypothetical protein
MKVGLWTIWPERVLLRNVVFPGGLVLVALLARLSRPAQPGQCVVTRGSSMKLARPGSW